MFIRMCQGVSSGWSFDVRSQSPAYIRVGGADKFDELRVVYECGMDDGSDIPSDMVQGMLRYIWACHNPTDTGGFDAALKTIKNYKLDVMDVNSLRFTESVTITDSAGVVLATSVACSIKQHVNGMRDPIADIAVYFNTLSVIALGWNGVQGSLRVVWRGLPVYWVYAVQFYDSGTRFGLFVVQQVRRFGSPHRFFCFRGCAAATVHCDSLADWHG